MKKITTKANGESSEKYTGQYCCLCWAEGREWKSASKTAITLLSETETEKGKNKETHQYRASMAHCAVAS